MTLTRWLLAGLVVMLSITAWIAEVHSAEPPSRPSATGPASRQAATRPAASKPAATKPAKPRLPKGFTAKKITMPDGSVRAYAVFVPPQYKLDESHKWPLIVALHGSGEIGQDGVKQTTLGLASYIVGRPRKFPFIVVFPQAHAMWFRGPEEMAVWSILDATMKEYRVDPERIFLTGLSMGGFATWEIAAARPDAFAAIIPICGAGPLGYMSNIANLPIWAFHGAIDANVPVARSRELIEELKRAGAQPRYTEYPGVEHDSWDAAYATPELWRWLLKQRRQSSPRTIDYKMCSRMAAVWWLAMEAESGAKSVPHIRAEIDESGNVSISSEHIVAWAISPGPELIAPDQEIEVTWNGKQVYKGEFKGMLGHGQVQTSRPAE